MTLSPEAQERRAQLEREANERRMAIWDGRRPMGAPARRLGALNLKSDRFTRAVGPSARSLGSLSLVTPGVAVWTDTERKRRSHDDSLGGIVLNITSRRLVDPDTGEITEHRAFRCYDPLVSFPDRSFRVFDEDLIGQDGVEAVDTNSLTTAVRRFCRRVADGHGLLVGSEARLVADAHRLAVVIMGGPR